MGNRYHTGITLVSPQRNLLDSFPSPKDSSENLFFRYFLHYIVAKWFEYSSVTPTSTPSIKLISVFDMYPESWTHIYELG